MARTNLSDRIAALETSIATLAGIVAAQHAPVAPAPAKAKAESPFLIAMRERAAAKVRCGIHPADKCNRRFSLKSSGATNHVARLD